MNNRTRLLILGAEDYTGLWDARFELANEQSPEEAAGQVLAELAQEGLVEFFIGSHVSQVPLRRLDDAEASGALRSGPQWSPPEAGTDGPLVYFVATDRGVDLIKRLNWGNAP